MDKLEKEFKEQICRLSSTGMWLWIQQKIDETAFNATEYGEKQERNRCQQKIKEAKIEENKRWIESTWGTIHRQKLIDRNKQLEWRK